MSTKVITELAFTAETPEAVKQLGKFYHEITLYRKKELEVSTILPTDGQTNSELKKLFQKRRKVRIARISPMTKNTGPEIDKQYASFVITQESANFGQLKLWKAVIAAIAPNITVTYIMTRQDTKGQSTKNNVGSVYPRLSYARDT